MPTRSTRCTPTSRKPRWEGTLGTLVAGVAIVRRRHSRTCHPCIMSCAPSMHTSNHPAATTARRRRASSRRLRRRRRGRRRA